MYRINNILIISLFVSGYFTLDASASGEGRKIVRTNIKKDIEIYSGGRQYDSYEQYKKDRERRYYGDDSAHLTNDDETMFVYLKQELKSVRKKMKLSRNYVSKLDIIQDNQQREKKDTLLDNSFKEASNSTDILVMKHMLKEYSHSKKRINYPSIDPTKIKTIIIDGSTHQNMNQSPQKLLDSEYEELQGLFKNFKKDHYVDPSITINPDKMKTIYIKPSH